jgi:hypothetical protein
MQRGADWCYPLLDAASASAVDGRRPPFCRREKEKATCVEDRPSFVKQMHSSNRRRVEHGRVTDARTLADHDAAGLLASWGGRCLTSAAGLSPAWANLRPFRCRCGVAAVLRRSSPDDCARTGASWATPKAQAVVRLRRTAAHECPAPLSPGAEGRI